MHECLDLMNVVLARKECIHTSMYHIRTYTNNMQSKHNMYFCL